MNNITYEDKDYIVAFDASEHSEYHFISDACRIQHISWAGGYTYPFVLIQFQDDIIPPLTTGFRIDTHSGGLVKNLLYNYLPFYVQTVFQESLNEKKVELIRAFEWSPFFGLTDIVYDDNHMFTVMKHRLYEEGYTINVGDMDHSKGMFEDKPYTYEYHISNAKAYVEAIRYNLNLIKDIKATRFRLAKDDHVYSQAINHVKFCAVKENSNWVTTDHKHPAYDEIDLKSFRCCEEDLDKEIGYKKHSGNIVITIVAKNDRCVLIRDDEYKAMTQLGEEYFTLLKSKYRVMCEREGEGKRQVKDYTGRYISLIDIPNGDKPLHLYHHSEASVEYTDHTFTSSIEQFNFLISFESHVDDIHVAEGRFKDRIKSEMSEVFCVAYIHDRVTYLSKRDPLSVKLSNLKYLAQQLKS